MGEKYVGGNCDESHFKKEITKPYTQYGDVIPPSKTVPFT